MYLIQNSQDILNVAKAVSVIGVSALLALFIYYLAMITRELFKTIREMRERIRRVDEVLEALKDRIEHSVSYLSLIGDGVKKIVEMVKEREEKKKPTRGAGKTKAKDK